MGENETPNIMYGRLKEAVNISGYSMERAMTEFDWLLDENRWMKVGDGFDDIDEFTKSINLAEFKIAIEQRKKISQKLAKIGASQRATAKMLGVSHTTIQTDIGNNLPPDEKSTTENQEDTNNSVNNLPPESISEPSWVNEKGRKIHTAQNSGENEWYTPPEYIESARQVMGSIDMDPASSDIANESVNATNYFTKDDDGLNKEWEGNVWLNPPYAQPLISHFADSVVEQRNNYSQATVLVNNATETGWLQTMLLKCDMACFVKGRIKFIDMNGNPGGAPLQGQVILYFGSNIDKFYNEFKKYGICMIRYKT